MKKFNKIMRTFNQVINKLEVLAEGKNIEKNKFRAKMMDAEQEETAATEVVKKLKDLVTPSSVKKENKKESK